LIEDKPNDVKPDDGTSKNNSVAVIQTSGFFYLIADLLFWLLN
jgi:hypothetical protein